MQSLIKLPHIACSLQNHRKNEFVFVCLNRNCITNGKQLCCLYCCTQIHGDHKQKIVSLKQVIQQIQVEEHNQNKINIVNVLLKGLQRCTNEIDLRQNLSQILAYKQHPQRFQKIIDQQTKYISKNINQFYDRLNQRQTMCVSQRKSINKHNYINPVLSFTTSHQYNLISPFCISAIQNKIITCFSKPSLSKYSQSIKTKVKINKCSPSWIGVGVSIGLNKYDQKSTSHILAFSNGWIFNKGQLHKSSIRFTSGNQLQIVWDKDRKQIQFINKGIRQVLSLESNWNQQVYLCICLYNKGDKITILS